MIPAAPLMALQAIPLVLSPIASAIKGIYQMGDSVNDYIDKHISEMKASTNQTISCSGKVLEAAKLGFGLGYFSSVAIIATGQILLGNTMAAVGVVTSAAVLSNPIAMTCAAFGAILYGWNALSDNERNAILDKLSAGLEVGVELIKSLINFTIQKSKEFLNSKQLAELKNYIKTQAAQFGKSLYDVTHAVGDLVKDTAVKVGGLAGQAVDATSTATRKVAERAGQAVDATSRKAADLAEQAVDATSSVTRKAVDLASDAATKVADAASETAKGVTDRIRGTDKA